jgi:hypothetical protein
MRQPRIVAVAGIVIVTAVVLFVAIRGGGSVSVPPTASAATASTSPTVAPSPSTSGPSTVAASATAATAPAGVPSDGYGFVLVFENSAKVRSETSDATISSIPAGGRSFTSFSRVVSPDGRLVAYWDPVNAPKTTGAVLKVRPAAGGTARAVLATRPELSGNAFAWSTDSAGLVAAIDDDCFLPVGCVRAGAEMWTVDLASGATEKIAAGKIWLPLVWDRVAKRVAAGVTGEGGYTFAYDIVDLSRQPYTVRSTPIQPSVIGRLKASSDGRSVLLTTFGQPDTLSWWPLAEPERRATIQYAGIGADWRPGTSEIWWVEGLAPSGCRPRDSDAASNPCTGTQIVLFDVASGARRVVSSGTYGSTVIGFRPDGSAAITGPTSPLVIVDARTGATASVPKTGEFVGSVLLR